MSLRSIYTYTNSRKYLKDAFEQGQKEEGWTYKSLSKKLGLSSTNYLSLVISGKKNLSLDLIHSIARVFRMTHEEHQFFEAMVLATQSSGADKRYYQTNMQSIAKRVGFGPQPSSSPTLVQEWSYPAILIALDGKNKKTAAADVKLMTGLSQAKIKQSITAFIEAGVLELKEDKYTITELFFSLFDKKGMKINYKNFLEKNLQRSLKVLQKAYHRPRNHFFCHNFTVSKSSYQNYVDRVDAFLDELTEDSNKETPEEVIQMNIQVFPFRQN